MSIDNISNDELLYLYMEENEDAKIILFKRLEVIIKSNIKKYHKVIKRLNINKQDLYLESLTGISDALNNYTYKSSISSFVDICVKRKIFNAIRSENFFKNKINNDSILFDEQIVLNNYDYFDPLKYLINLESYNIIENKIKNALSEFEFNVYKYLVLGFKYKEIAKLLNKDIKQIDNAIQRLRKKIKNACI